MNKCYGCLFVGEYRDMGASTPLCNRCAGLCEAVEEYKKAEPCKYYITKAEIIRLQNEGVIEPKPFIPPEKPKTAKEGIQSLSEVARMASEAINKAIAVMRKATEDIKNGGKTE